MKRILTFCLLASLIVYGAGFSLKFDTAEQSTVFEPGKIQIFLQVYAQVPDYSGVVLTADLLGVMQNKTKLSLQPALANGQGFQECDLAFEVSEPGLYEITATLSVPETDNRILATASTYCLVSPRLEKQIPDLGIQTHLAKWGHAERLLEYVRHIGLSRIRDEVYWNVIERKPGVFAWPERHDRMIALAAKYSLHPLLILDYGNPNAYPELFTKARSFPNTPESRKLFLAYVEQQIRHYGHAVKAWELWNEPNNVKPPIYTELLKEVYVKIKELDPQATVISCGGGGAGGGPSAAYITPIIRNGGLEYQDAFSIHPYMSPANPDQGYGPCKGSPLKFVSVPNTWRFLKDFCDKHPRANGKTLRFWVTEIGWPTGEGRNTCSESDQAAYIARLLLQHRRMDCADALFIYDLLSDGPQRSNAEHNFGLLHHDLSPKPAFAALAAFNRLVGSKKCTKVLVDDDNVKMFVYEDTLVAYACNKRTPCEIQGLEEVEVYQWDGYCTKQKAKEGKITLKLNALPVYMKILKGTPKPAPIGKE